MAVRYTRSFACCGYSVRVDSPVAWPLATLADLFRALAPSGGGAPEPTLTLRRRSGEYRVVRHLPGGANREAPVGRDCLVPLLEREVNQAFAMSFSEHLVLHAGVIACRGKAILLPAPSGSGKTTLVASLVERGCGYLTDELALLALHSSEVTPYPKALALKEGSFDHFARLGLRPAGGERGRIGYLDPERLRAGCIVQHALEVGSVVFPRYLPGVAADLEALTPGETAIALFANTVNIARHKEKGLDLLIGLAREVRGYRLAFADLSLACKAVLSVLFRGSHEPR